MLGELIQSLWGGIKNSTKTEKSKALQEINQEISANLDLQQGKSYLQYRENKLERGQPHITMLTADMKIDE